MFQLANSVCSIEPNDTKVQQCDSKLCTIAIPSEETMKYTSKSDEMFMMNQNNMNKQQAMKKIETEKMNIRFDSYKNESP